MNIITLHNHSMVFTLTLLITLRLDYWCVFKHANLKAQLWEIDGWVQTKSSGSFDTTDLPIQLSLPDNDSETLTLHID